MTTYAHITDDSENQVCGCGNDTYSNDWCAADADGHLNPAHAGTERLDLTTVCPTCGAIYSNTALMTAEPHTPIAAIGHRDLDSTAWRLELADYNRSLYETGTEARA